MKKILIVGALGYLGSELSRYLLKLDYEVVGIDIGLFQFGIMRYPRIFEVIYKSASEINEHDIKGFDVVIQLAGISNDPFSDFEPNSIYEPTRAYAVNIAKICKKLGVKYIFPSSCSVYGYSDSPITESDQTFPKTPYSKNKIDIEKDLMQLADDSFSPIALRLATVFGFSDRIRFDVVINMLAGMAYSERKVVLNSDGSAWRPHVHINDVCQAFEQVIEFDYTSPELLVLNVGKDSNNWQILDVAKCICQLVEGCKLEFLDSNSDNVELIRDRKIQDGVDSRNYRVSFEKIHSTLPGFECKIDVKTGIQRLLNEFSEFDLTQTKFKQRDFYRLQQLEHLVKTNQNTFLNL